MLWCRNLDWVRSHLYCVWRSVSARCVNTNTHMYSWQRISLVTHCRVKKRSPPPPAPPKPRPRNTKLLNLRLKYRRGTRERLDTKIDWPSYSPNVTHWSVYKRSINCKEYLLLFCVLDCNISDLFVKNTGLQFYHCVTSAQADISGNWLPLPYRKVTPPPPSATRYNQVQYRIVAVCLNFQQKKVVPNHLPYVTTWWRQILTLIHLHVFY
jgi:hypothetical protein